MAQWTNQKIRKSNAIVHQPMDNPGGLYLAEPGIMAGRQADEIWAGYDILEVCCRLKSSIFCFV